MPVSRYVTRERFADLHGGTAETFSAWLLDGFRADANPQPGTMPWGDAWPFVNMMGLEHISDDIAAIYSVLNAGEQTAFKSGMALAFEKLDWADRHDQRVGTSLFYTSAAITHHDAQAKREVARDYLAPALPVVFGAEAQLQKTDMGKTVLLLATEVKKGLGATRPDPAAPDCTQPQSRP